LHPRENLTVRRSADLAAIGLASLANRLRPCAASPLSIYYDMTSRLLRALPEIALFSGHERAGGGFVSPEPFPSKSSNVVFQSLSRAGFSPKSIVTLIPPTARPCVHASCSSC
jgi:hypothetical protein